MGVCTSYKQKGAHAAALLLSAQQCEFVERVLMAALVVWVGGFALGKGCGGSGEVVLGQLGVAHIEDFMLTEGYTVVGYIVESGNLAANDISAEIHFNSLYTALTSQQGIAALVESLKGIGVDSGAVISFQYRLSRGEEVSYDLLNKEVFVVVD